MKLPSVYAELCFKQVFENATSGRNSRCRSVVNSTSCQLQLPWTVPVTDGSRSCRVTCAAATPPNQPQRCILTDYFNNYIFRKFKLYAPWWWRL